jgi:hypothetical protein
MSAKVFQSLFDAVAAGGIVALPPGQFEIDKTLDLAFTDDTFNPVGTGYGLTLISAITDGSPVLRITVASGKAVRGLILAGFAIVGNGKEGNGIEISVPGNDAWLYNFVLRDLMIERCGGDGINATGSVFEGLFERVCPRNNLRNGATLGQGAQGGTLSSITWRDGSIGQNGRYGMELTGDAYDVSLRDTYILENGDAGLVIPNGLTSMQGGGFENNRQNIAPGAAIVGQNFGSFGLLTEGSNNGKQTSLMDQFYLVQYLNLIGVGAQNGIGHIAGTGSVNRIGGVGTMTTADPIKLFAA